MNETTVLQELKTWSQVDSVSFTAVNLSALARVCDLRRDEAVMAVRDLVESGDLEQVQAVDPASHTNVFRLNKVSE